MFSYIRFCLIFNGVGGEDGYVGGVVNEEAEPTWQKIFTSGAGQ